MNVTEYLARQYPAPPCWYLVMDVLRRECGFAAADHTPADDAPLAIAHAFRLALHLGGLKGFRRIEAPADFAVVFLARQPGGTPQHCGIWYRKRILHATRSGVAYEQPFTLADRYRHFEYWTHDGHH